MKAKSFYKNNKHNNMDSKEKENINEEDRQKYIDAWTKMMIEIWQDKMIRLKVMHTAALYRSLNGEIKANDGSYSISHSVPRPPPAIFHRAIHTALCLKCTACLFHSIVPDTFLRDPPESLPRYTFLPLSSALLYNFPLLHYCHAGIDTTQVSYVCRFLSTTFDFCFNALIIKIS